MNLYDITTRINNEYIKETMMDLRENHDEKYDVPPLHKKFKYDDIPKLTQLIHTDDILGKTILRISSKDFRSELFVLFTDLTYVCLKYNGNTDEHILNYKFSIYDLTDAGLITREEYDQFQKDKQAKEIREQEDKEKSMLNDLANKYGYYLQPKTGKDF